GVSRGGEWKSSGGEAPARAGSAPEDLLHLLALGQFVDELVHPADLLHQRILDILDSDAADHARDQVDVLVQGRGGREKSLQVDAGIDGGAEPRNVMTREPREHLVEFFDGAALALDLRDVQRVDVGERSARNAEAGHDGTQTLSPYIAVV